MASSEFEEIRDFHKRVSEQASNLIKKVSLFREFSRVLKNFSGIFQFLCIFIYFDNFIDFSIAKKPKNIGKH